PGEREGERAEEQDVAFHARSTLLRRRGDPAAEVFVARGQLQAEGPFERVAARRDGRGVPVRGARRFHARDPGRERALLLEIEKDRTRELIVEPDALAIAPERLPLHLHEIGQRRNAALLEFGPDGLDGLLALPDRDSLFETEVLVERGEPLARP